MNHSEQQAERKIITGTATHEKAKQIMVIRHQICLWKLKDSLEKHAKFWHLREI